MKKLLLASLLAAFVSGCGSSPEPVDEQAANLVTPAPPGMIAIKDLEPLAPGTAIYSEDGKPIGSIKEYNAKHEFPDKTIASAVLLERSPGVEEWVLKSVVDDAFLIRQ